MVHPLADAFLARDVAPWVILDELNGRPCGIGNDVDPAEMVVVIEAQLPGRCLGCKAEALGDDTIGTDLIVRERVTGDARTGRLPHALPGRVVGKRRAVTPLDRDRRKSVVLVPRERSPGPVHHVAVGVVRIALAVGATCDRGRVEGIRIRVGDAGFREDVADRVVAVRLARLGREASRAGTERAGRRGQAVQSIVGEHPTRGMYLVRDLCDVTDRVVGVTQVLKLRSAGPCCRLIREAKCLGVIGPRRARPVRVLHLSALPASVVREIGHVAGHCSKPSRLVERIGHRFAIRERLADDAVLRVVHLRHGVCHAVQDPGGLRDPA